jgi:hypothetical protein
MKTYGGVNIFLTSALVGSEWSASRPCRFIPGETGPGTQWIGDWVGTRASLDEISGVELRALSRLARSQSLYRLRYLDSPLIA